MRRKKWKAPNNPTVQARQIWRVVYGEPWPKGWKVKWVGFMRGASGLTSYGRKEIVLNYGDAKRGDRWDHEELYANALAHAFWFSLYIKPYYVPKVVDGHVVYDEHWDAEEKYNWWARQASRQRLEMARHSTLERGAIEVLLHEFVHVRHRNLKHGVEFDRLVEWSRAKLMAAQVVQIPQ